MQDLLGDLNPKGEKCGSKQDKFPTKGEMFPRRKKSIFQGGDMPSESSHEEEVAR